MKKLEGWLFVAGALIFAILLYQFGLRNLVENIRRAGLWIAVVFALYISVYALNTQTWRLILGEARRRFSWRETFRFTVSAFALNYITPLVMLGGEAYRAYALTPRLDARTAAASVVLFRLLHTLAHLLIWVAALGMAFFLLPRSPALVATLSLTGIVLAALLALLFLGPRHGVVGKLFAAIERVRFLQPIGRALATKRQALANVNEIIIDFYRRRRAALFLGIGLEFVARLVAAMENYLILHSVGIAIMPWHALYIYAAASLFANLFFFMPFELGVKEGGLYFILPTLGVTPTFGIFIGVAGRIREFFWIFVGLIFLLAQRQRGWLVGKLTAPDLGTLTAEPDLMKDPE